VRAANAVVISPVLIPESFESVGLFVEPMRFVLSLPVVLGGLLLMTARRTVVSVVLSAVWLDQPLLCRAGRIDEGFGRAMKDCALKDEAWIRLFLRSLCLHPTS